MDTVQLDLGISLKSGLLHTLIPRNSYVPPRGAVKLVTVSDKQSRVVVNIIEGKRKVANRNKLLGTLELIDLPLGRKGEVELDLVFQVDDDFVLTASLTEKETKKKAQLVLPLGGERYSVNEIDDLVRRADARFEDDWAYLKESGGWDGEGVMLDTDLGGE